VFQTHLEKCEQFPLKCSVCSESIKKSEYLKHLEFRHHEIVFPKLSLINQLLIFPSKDIMNHALSVTEYSNKAQINPYNGSKARLGSNGKFYCGNPLDGRMCGCCDGYCGPVDGCNCSGCMELDLKLRKLPKGWLVNSDGFPSTKCLDNGVFYCGRRVIIDVLECDGFCGPIDGPNCLACQKLHSQSNHNGRYSNLI